MHIATAKWSGKTFDFQLPGREWSVIVTWWSLLIKKKIIIIIIVCECLKWMVLRHWVGRSVIGWQRAIYRRWAQIDGPSRSWMACPFSSLFLYIFLPFFFAVAFGYCYIEITIASPWNDGKSVRNNAIALFTKLQLKIQQIFWGDLYSNNFRLILNRVGIEKNHSRWEGYNFE